MGFRSLRGLIWLIAVVTTAGCDGTSGGNGGQDDRLQAEADIIGGFEAPSLKLNAVGTIGFMDPGAPNPYTVFCSATLIAPDKVLTAKHCAGWLDEEGKVGRYTDVTEVYFAVGPNAQTPLQIVQAYDVDLAPGWVGGFVENGSDVAVYHLLKPVVGVTPFAIAPRELCAADVGRRFTTLGYGIRANTDDDQSLLPGVRTIGAETLRALSGQSNRLLIGTLDTYLDAMRATQGVEAVEYSLEYFTSLYENTVILEGYEMLTGGKAGDTQSCNGDSGGPWFLRGANGSPQIYGVTSGGLGSANKVCDFGSFVATFGPETRAMITTALAKKDPCKGASVKGSCEGNIAVRCTSHSEGPRQLSKVDCAQLELTCGKNAEGRVACVDPNAPSTTPAAPPPGPSIAALSARIARARNGLSRLK